MPITRTCDTCSNNRSALVSQFMNQPRPINRSAAATTEASNDVDVIARFIIGDGDEHAEVELVVDTGNEILWNLNKSPQGRLTCKNSSSLFCYDPRCNSLGTHCRLCTLASVYCRFREEYGGSLHTEGFLVRDKILLRTLRSPFLDLGEITFGCNYLARRRSDQRNHWVESRFPLLNPTTRHTEILTLHSSAREDGCLEIPKRKV
ncbi:hypothetical protein AAHE18_13G031500 [Arachis hypogaea]